jgi:WD40 repeat protein
MALEAVPAAAPNPFQGLRPIEDPNALFGRDLDFTVLRERIYSGRTTLFFAASGAGKTSLLKAKLLPGLESEFTICMHNAWADLEPRKAVMNSMAKGLGKSAYDAAAPMEDLLESFLRQPPPKVFSNDLPLRPSREREKEFLLVLDQFEEVFQYWANRPEFRRFLDELCAIVNRDDLKVRVMISMRDDFLGSLSAFDNRIPDLFNNYCRLKYPTKSQAMEIIQRTAGDADAAGLRKLVEDLATFQRTVSEPPLPLPALSLETLTAAIAMQRIIRPFVRAFRFFFPSGQEQAPKTEALKRDFVVPPYLQIVCAELWERRKPDSPRFLADYGAGAVAGNAAADILTGFCQKRLRLLGSTRRQDLAAQAFDFLMTREGAKMAYQLSRLAEHMEVNQLELQPVLKDLSKESTRILRSFKGTDGAWWYELYHDMYAPILYEWTRTHQKQRNRQTRFRSTVIASLLVVLGVWLVPVYDDLSIIASSVSDYPVSAYESLKSRLTLGGLLPFVGALADERWARYWDRRAEQAELAEDRDRAVLLRSKALESKDTSQRRADAERVLGNEYAANLQVTLHPSGKPTLAVLSLDEKRIFVGGKGFWGQVWDVESGRPIAAKQGVAASSLSAGSETPPDAANRMIPVAAAFVGADRLATLTGDNEFQFWTTSPPESPGALIAGRICRGITAFALDGAGQTAFVAAADGTVKKWALDALENSCKAREEYATGALKNPAAAVQAATAAPRPSVHLVNSMVLSPDGKALLTSTDNGTVVERSVEDGSVLKVIVSGARSIAVSADASHIAWIKVMPQRKGKIEILDRSGHPGTTSIDIDDASLPILDFNPDGGLLTCWTIYRYRIFDTRSGALVRDQPDDSDSPGPYMSNSMIAYAPSGKLVTLFDSGSRSLMQPFPRTDVAGMLQFSLSGKYLITGAPNVVRIWTTAPHSPFPAGDLEASATFAVNQDGKCRASLGKTGRIVLRRIGHAEELFGADVDSAPGRLAVSPGCQMMAAAWEDGTIRLWERESKREIGNNIRHGSALPRLLFSPDRKRLLTFSGRSAILWNTADGSQVREIAGLPAARFTPDSRLLYPRSAGTSIYWSDSGVETGAYLPPFTRTVAFDSANTTMAVGTASGVEVLDLRRPAAFRWLFPISFVDGVAVSPGGTTFAALSGGVLNLATASSGKPTSIITGSRDFSLVRFSSHNRQWMLTASRSGAVQLRDAATGSPIGAPAVVQPGAAAAEAASPVILSAEFMPDAEYVLVVTSQWMHLLRATNKGLLTFQSRQLSGLLEDPSQVYPLDGFGLRVAAIVSLGRAAGHLDVVDFGETGGRPQAARYSLEDWQRKLGLLVEQGDIIPLTPR